jgi:large subunit ribosomal protein L25
MESGMDNATLNVTTRQGRGKGAAKRLRRLGRIPGVVYGGETASMAIEAETHEIEMLLTHHGGSRPVQVDFKDGGDDEVLIRDLQRDPLTEHITHVDLLRVTDATVVTVDVPVTTVGSAAGTQEGGILQVSQHMLSTQCQVQYIPENIEVDVSALEIGDSITIGDLDLENLNFTQDSDLPVVMVSAPLAEEEPEELDLELEEGAEPELVGAEDDESEEDEEE